MAKNPHELEEFLAPLTNAGVDIFHCSNRRFFEPEFEGSNLNLAGWTKKITGRSTITVGSIGLDNDFVNTFLGQKTKISETTIDRLLERLAADEFDLAAVGRMLLANPDWQQKIKEGRFAEIVLFSKEHVDNLY